MLCIVRKNALRTGLSVHCSQGVCDHKLMFFLYALYTNKLHPTEEMTAANTIFHSKCMSFFCSMAKTSIMMSRVMMDSIVMLSPPPAISRIPDKYRDNATLRSRPEMIGRIKCLTTAKMRRFSYLSYIIRTTMTMAPEAATLRQQLLSALELPAHLSPNAMLPVLNALFSYEELATALVKLTKTALSRTHLQCLTWMNIFM